MKILQYKLGDNYNMKGITEFIVKENYKHHSKDFHSIQNIEKEVDNIYAEELKYDNSKTLISLDMYQEITGTIRIIKWNYKDILPIQKLFNINPLDYLPNNSYKIWHIGRFAIKKGVGNSIFKILLVSAISEVCSSENNTIVFAECDAKLLRVLKKLGIEPTIIGNSIHYLGSETIPVLFTYETLRAFLDKNSNYPKV